ncbi:MAG: lytic murein transglycosylase B, partial [Betaproteobacteria bacterium]|nr:lytic murein transglycosylase B [Betaproteobacteria bacterium]
MALLTTADTLAKPIERTRQQAATSPTKSAHKANPKKAFKVTLGKAFGHSASVKALAAALAKQTGLPKAWVQQQIASAHLLPQVQNMIMPAPYAVAKNWAAYRARFLEPNRIQKGVAFWQTHADVLARAEKTFGVPARYIVGILGVETYFGQHQGQFKVSDVLATLSLAFPADHPQAEERRQFFTTELGYFLQQRFKQPSLKQQLGSYAGASGWPQFMPSSIAKFAVDFDQDGHVNLAHSAADAIGSVAHYFQAYGWQTGMPTHFEVVVQASESDLSA